MKKKILLIFVFVLLLMGSLINFPTYAQGRLLYGEGISAKLIMQKLEFVEKINAILPLRTLNGYNTNLVIKNYVYNFMLPSEKNINLSFEKDFLRYINSYRSKYYKIIPTGTLKFSYWVDTDGSIHVRVIHDAFSQEEIINYTVFIESLKKELPNDYLSLSDSEKLELAFEIVSGKLNIGKEVGDWKYYNNHIRAIQHPNRETVCNGWSNFSSDIFEVLGLESKVIHGVFGYGRDKELHAWNQVKVDGQWIHADFMYVKGYSNYKYLKMNNLELLSYGYNYFINY